MFYNGLSPRFNLTLFILLLFLPLFAIMPHNVEAKSIETNTTTRFLILTESINLANIADFKDLLVDGADVDAPNRFGATALHMASLVGNKEIVQLLLDVKANINKPTMKERVTPLYLAAQNGHADVVSLLIGEGADISLPRSSDGATPLWIASQEGHSDVVKYLLNSGADANTARRTDGANALYMASQNGYPHVVKLLIDARAEVNKSVSSFGVTPLYIASQNGHMEVVKLLCEAGADANIVRSNDKVSPLWIASQEGHLDVVTLLLSLKRELKPKVMAWESESPKGREVSTKKSDGERGLLDEEGSRENPNEALMLILEGQIELDKSAESGKEDRAGSIAVNVDARNLSGYTALMLASLRSHKEIVSALLSKGADVNARSNIGKTPLMLASEHGSVDIAKELIKWGADVSARSDNGESALDVARVREHENLVKLLTKIVKAEIN